MIRSAVVRLSDVVFLRLSAGDPAWLDGQRWSPETLARLRRLPQLALCEREAASRLAALSGRFPPADWASLWAWVQRAARRESAGTPHLLRRDREAGSL